MILRNTTPLLSKCLTFILLFISLSLTPAYSQDTIQLDLDSLATFVDFSPGVGGNAISQLITTQWMPITIDSSGNAKGAILSFSKPIQDPICLEEPETEGCALDLVLELKTYGSEKFLGRLFSDSWSTGNNHAITVNTGAFAIVPLQEGKVQIRRLGEEEVVGRYNQNSKININVIALFY